MGRLKARRVLVGVRGRGRGRGRGREAEGTPGPAAGWGGWDQGWDQCEASVRPGL